MAKFMFIYLDPIEKTVPQPSPEEMQNVMQTWWEWLGRGQQEGWCVAMGDPLHATVKTVGPDHVITDGPHAEAKELVGGYSIVQADTIEEACEHAKGCPIFSTGGRVEVREIVDTGEADPAE